MRRSRLRAPGRQASPSPWVANEVKELARQTANATEEIGHQIETTNEDVKNAIDSIAQLTEVINEVSELSNSIASAVEEQTAATKEMTRNLTEVASSAPRVMNGSEAYLPQRIASPLIPRHLAMLHLPRAFQRFSDVRIAMAGP